MVQRRQSYAVPDSIDSGVSLITDSPLTITAANANFVNNGVLSTQAFQNSPLGTTITITASQINQNGQITGRPVDSVLFLPNTDVPISLGGSNKVSGFSLVSQEIG